MKVWSLVVAVPLALAALTILAGQLGFLSGSTPQKMGVQNGRLKPPSATPNSVSSQADLYPDHPQRSYARIAPLTFQGDADAAMHKLVRVLQQLANTRLVEQQPDYLYAQSSTPLLKFVDDLEFALDRKANLIHVRSASRLGRSDLGANRARVEKIRAQFQQN